MPDRAVIFTKPQARSVLRPVIKTQLKLKKKTLRDFVKKQTKFLPIDSKIESGFMKVEQEGSSQGRKVIQPNQFGSKSSEMKEVTNINHSCRLAKK